MSKKKATTELASDAPETFVVCHPVTRNGHDFEPGDDITFEPALVGTTVVDGEVQQVFQTADDLQAEIDGMLSSRVIARKADGKTALAAADAARGAARNSPGSPYSPTS